jgi:hypothetical protein
VQFFHNPLQPPTGAAAVDKDKAVALSLWNKVESAIREQAAGDQILFHAEVKRLCLVVEAGLELWDPKKHPDQDAKAIFLRQLSIQLRILAHMRKLDPARVEQAAQQAAERSHGDASGTRSGAEYLLESLQNAITLSEEQLLEGIGVQPLALVLVEKQQLFEELGPHFYRLHDHVGKRRADVERTLGQLLTLHSRKAT